MANGFTTEAFGVTEDEVRGRREDGDEEVMAAKCFVSGVDSS